MCCVWGIPLFAHAAFFFVKYELIVGVNQLLFATSSTNPEIVVIARAVENFSRECYSLKISPSNSDQQHPHKSSSLLSSSLELFSFIRRIRDDFKWNWKSSASAELQMNRRSVLRLSHIQHFHQPYACINIVLKFEKFKLLCSALLKQKKTKTWDFPK